KPEGSIYISIQALLYDFKIGLIINSYHNSYNIDVTSSISSAVRYPFKSTLPPPPVMPVGLHFPFILHSYIGPGMVSPTIAQSPTTGDGTASSSNLRVENNPLLRIPFCLTFSSSVEVLLKLLLRRSAASLQIPVLLLLFSSISLLYF